MNPKTRIAIPGVNLSVSFVPVFMIFKMSQKKDEILKRNFRSLFESMKNRYVLPLINT